MVLRDGVNDNTATLERALAENGLEYCPIHSRAMLTQLQNAIAEARRSVEQEPTEDEP